jgi:hypothetical protein
MWPTFGYKTSITRNLKKNKREMKMFRASTKLDDNLLPALAPHERAWAAPVPPRWGGRPRAGSPQSYCLALRTAIGNLHLLVLRRERRGHRQPESCRFPVRGQSEKKILLGVGAKIFRGSDAHVRAELTMGSSCIVKANKISFGWLIRATNSGTTSDLLDYAEPSSQSIPDSTLRVQCKWLQQILEIDER